MTAPLRPVRLGKFETVVTRRADGTLDLRCAQPLGNYPTNITQCLAHWAKAAPDRIYLAQRGANDAWCTLTYAQVYEQVRRIAQALLDRDLSPERPIVILSGNGIEHALLALAAMHIGIPYAPVSPAYSLMSSDFGKLRAIYELLTPGLVFAADATAFSRALDLAPKNAERMTGELANADPTTAVDAAHARVSPDSIAKFLFTSGSTGNPKGVINTQRMLCANQAMLAAAFEFLDEAPPVVVDWLPWSHTFGSNHNFNMVLMHGGSLYIDDGNPTPPGVPKTVRNLREISPTAYFNVPKGYEALVPHLRADKALRENFFRRLKVLFYAGAGLNETTWRDMQQLAVDTTGERVIFISSIGSTETAPLALACTFDCDKPGNIGLPAPGVELKLVPNEGKMEARLRGPHITPGYWRQQKLTTEAFDDEGYYKIGDAMKFADANDPQKGLLFDGRLAEDFKLATGTWVSVGPLRGKLIDVFAPFARDVVLTGLDRDEVGALVFPDIEACRKLAALPAEAPAASVLSHAAVSSRFAEMLAALAKLGGGSSTRVSRAILLETPPSLDAGEATDKGSINQRAVLANRAALVDELYAQPLSPRVISIGSR